MTIDGLDFEFMLAPDTEAPAEMHWFIEQFAAVTAAENCCHTLHNTYTHPRAPRSAIRRRGRSTCEQTIDRWGDRAEVMYGMHHWPVWGRDRVLEMLGKARDGYRYINDQTLRLANHGYTPVEIAEQVEFPPELGRHWAMRGYYGTLNHNVKATYVKYLGWFDGNPANLHTHPPEDAAKRYVEFMGGADAALDKARGAFELGDYRWVAEVVNHVVFADPDNQDARELQADALEQLGYQAESGPWRNFYLTAAKELRDGVARAADPEHGQPRLGPGDEHRAVPRLPRRCASTARRPATARSRSTLTLPDIGETWTLMVAQRRAQPLARARHDDARRDRHDRPQPPRRHDPRRRHRSPTRSPTAPREVDGDEQRAARLRRAARHFEFWFNIVTP